MGRLIGFLLAVISLLGAQELPFQLPDLKKLQKIKVAELNFAGKSVIFELYPELAPTHVANLKWLSDNQFYKNRKIDKIRDDYAVLIGKISKTEPQFAYTLPPEFSQEEITRGSLLMARAKDTFNPERRSHGTAILIILKDSPHLTGNITLIGKAKRGLEHLDKLLEVSNIENLTVYVLKE